MPRSRYEQRTMRRSNSWSGFTKRGPGRTHRTGTGTRRALCIPQHREMIRHKWYQKQFEQQYANASNKEYLDAAHGAAPQSGQPKTDVRDFIEALVFARMVLSDG